MVSGKWNVFFFKTTWDCFFQRTCELIGVILKTCVSAINGLTVIILSELEKDLHFVAVRILMINFCQVGKNSCMRSGLT